MKLARKKGYWKIEVENDSSAIVFVLNKRKGNQYWKIDPIVAEIQTKREYFQVVKFLHVKRSANKAAH